MKHLFEDYQKSLHNTISVNKYSQQCYVINHIRNEINKLTIWIFFFKSLFQVDMYRLMLKYVLFAQHSFFFEC